MYQIFAEVIGGVGLFLLGMTLMTNGLKDIAGSTLKSLLTQFTNTPSKAMLSGIGLTLILHSSTATTVATVGFVNSGVMSFTQAIGVIIGANIGTTSTGWLVALLGLKFSISLIALPLIGFGAILNLISKERWGVFGLILAGFGMIFFGISVLQEAMAGMSEHGNLSILVNDGLWSKLLLVVLGIILTVILQSSSASITATLAALASGSIDFSQAIYLVVGQNVGAVSITIISAIGASLNAKRTVAVNVVFNVCTAIIAFFTLAPLFVYLYQDTGFLSQFDPLILLALFHTAFSLLGACVFMPTISQLEKLLIKLIPEEKSAILACLDESSLSIPSVAIQSAEKVQNSILIEMFNILHAVFKDGVTPTKSTLSNLDHHIFQLEKYLGKITVPNNHEFKAIFISLLRVMIYVRVLRSDLENIDYAVILRTHPAVLQLGLDYSHILETYIQSTDDLLKTANIEQLHIELNNLKKWTSQHRADIRSKILEFTDVNQMNASKGVELLAAQRWMDRLVAHTYRFSNVLYESKS